ncbi:hypothetical protein [Micromonospora sp. WMMD1082]|uniref:hypothetical protein n=1 Tax=Micromonospora sp. WMMD1082 TaxID=3016104 RepID=UPI0024174F9A|nr:hypothetical protein [Micromonospora sp. WMMD1082]MDG4795395.1 hypothetical protein [Micromonospora sp. WMMD1082]
MGGSVLPSAPEPCPLLLVDGHNPALGCHHVAQHLPPTDTVNTLTRIRSAIPP